MYEEARKKTKIDNEQCRVCGDPAAGFHFGVFTCEGCKSFFGRAHHKKLLAECKKKGKCVINRTTRTKCKLCRLRKCFAVGMSKEASRYGRRSTYFKVHCMNDKLAKSSKRTMDDSSSVTNDASLNKAPASPAPCAFQQSVQTVHYKEFFRAAFERINCGEITKPVPRYPDAVHFPFLYASSFFKYHAAFNDEKSAYYERKCFTPNTNSIPLSSPASSWDDRASLGQIDIEQNKPLDLSIKRNLRENFKNQLI